MAEIAPFRGIHYNTDQIASLEQVIGPPYDVISPDEQSALYAASPYNYVRVMLNRAEPGDDDSNNPYTRAAQSLRAWLEQGILVEDSAPALYLYRQEFNHPVEGTRHSRTTLCCALKLEPYASGIVLPHEETRTKAKEDRLRLMRATHTNPEPIFGLFEDPTGFTSKVMDLQTGRESPFLAAEVNGETHQVWRLSDPEAITALQRFFADRRIWIADGHHRYETALAYQEEARVESRESKEKDASRKSQIAGEGIQNSELGTRYSRLTTPDSPPSDYLLIALSPFSDPGVVVLPTHRLVRNLPENRLEQLNLQLERYFDILPVSPEELSAMLADSREEGLHSLGMVSREGAWLLTLRDESVMDAAVEGHSPAWKRLDVSILHTLALERSLGLPAAALTSSTDIGYTRDREEAVAMVRCGTWQLAFLLHLPSADEVRQVAAAGDRMPAKSTFFYPKLWSGLLLRRL